MTMMNANYSPTLAPYLGRRGALRTAPLLFFDVGVSGGVHPVWETFGEDLRVWGFDPLIHEIERLQALDRRGHTYECAFVGFLPYRARHAPADWWQLGARNNQPWARTTPPWALALLDMDWTSEVYNNRAEVALTDRVISIDQYCAEAGIADIDFLKIDTDGSDYEVLLGAEHMLSVGGLLGIQVEAQFHGAVDRDANLFSNIDLFLRARGFSLFDLDPWRYARAALPRPSVYDIPAQTRRGQINWAEALYLRDLGDPYYEKKWAGLDAAAWGPTKVLKLAALFDLFNLQDCAVELLQKYAVSLEAFVKADEMIAAMLPPVAGQPVTYDQFLEYCRELVRQKRYQDIPI
jgi:hypothetical protein